MDTVYLAGGCFWGVEQFLSQIKGVLQTEVGYANGITQNPSYEEVCTGKTGHVEAVRVCYDAHVLPLSFLLSLFFEIINPTLLNRQGPDEGTQYRTGIYTVDESAAAIAAQALYALQARTQGHVVVECLPLGNFYPAEAYHQRYLAHRPGGYCHIPIAKMRMAAQAKVDPSAFSKPEEEALLRQLPAISYAVTQQAATEPPHSHPYGEHVQPGLYVDITTGEPLFSSRDKFQSSCGWPSFSTPIDPFVTYQREDVSHGTVRTEVKSRVGNAHLGHVFEDGPRENGGLRYCINGAALRFIPKEDMQREGYGDFLAFIE